MHKKTEKQLYNTWARRIIYVLMTIFILLLLTIGFIVGRVTAEEITRICYVVHNNYTWCEPDYALYNKQQYEVLNAEWLVVQLNGNAAQKDNSQRWVGWILEGKQ